MAGDRIRTAVAERDNFTRLIPSPCSRYSPLMDCNAYKRIPNDLRFRRIRRGLWQKDVAAKLGLKDTALLSRWENGGSFPNLVNILRLSALYQTSIDDLFPRLVKAVRDEIITGK